MTLKRLQVSRASPGLRVIILKRLQRAGASRRAGAAFNC
jgi:hypothetical protein